MNWKRALLTVSSYMYNPSILWNSRGQNSLEAESFQPKSPLGERTDDDCGIRKKTSVMKPLG